jgi:hypothetical protein
MLCLGSMMDAKTKCLLTALFLPLGFSTPNESSRYVSRQSMPVHINLWLFKGLAPKNGLEVEVIIHNFKFTPQR